MITKKQALALDGHTPGPWAMETVRTSCGTCHRIGPFPRPVYSSRSEGWACVYDDYPPGMGSPDLLANARLISAAPDLLATVIALHKRVERMEEAATLALSDMEVAFKPHTSVVELIRLGTGAALRLRAILKETTHD